MGKRKEVASQHTINSCFAIVLLKCQQIFFYILKNLFSNKLKVFNLLYACNRVLVRSSSLIKCLKPSVYLLVVRGYIHPLFSVGNGQKEPANIIATELIRQEKNIFVKSKETGDKFRALVEVPAGCHWKQMEKVVFLLTGNLESGKGPVLQCHIKEEIWVKLKKETILNLCGLVHVKAKLKEAKTF